MTISKRRNSKQSRAHRLEAVVSLSLEERKRRIEMALMCIYAVSNAIGHAPKQVILPILFNSSDVELATILQEAVGDLKQLTGV